MKFSIVVFLIIFSIIIFPTAYGQISNEESVQKSVEVKIDVSGEVQVIHELRAQNSPHQLDLIKGTISNLIVKDEEGNEVQYGKFGESLMILPSKEDVIVEYDLADELNLIDNVWTWDFLYLESTAFIFPEQVDLVFVNDRPAYLGETKGIKCHGCQMKLEYSIDEPKMLELIKFPNQEFLIETRTWSDIDQFNFNAVSETINFEVKEGDNFVTIVVPVELLIEPYEVFLDGEKIFFHKFNNNGTNVWLSIRPDVSGGVSISGTISPEIEMSPENNFPYEFIVIGILIGGAVVAVAMFKRKK